MASRSMNATEGSLVGVSEGAGLGSSLRCQAMLGPAPASSQRCTP